MLRSNNEPCLNCKRLECPGVCDRLKEGMKLEENLKGSQTITWQGITRPIGEWAEILGVSRQTLYRRLEAATDEGDVISRIIIGKKDCDGLNKSCIEEAYIRISTMHLDYLLYWNRLGIDDSSRGMVARYGEIRTAPTNAVSKPTEMNALPEVCMSEEALYRRGWVACVLYIIEQYRIKKDRTSQLKAKYLKWRAIDGYTVRRISEEGNKELYESARVTPMQIRKYMDAIVQDVAREARSRNLVRSIQK